MSKRTTNWNLYMIYKKDHNSIDLYKSFKDKNFNSIWNQSMKEIKNFFNNDHRLMMEDEPEWDTIKILKYRNVKLEKNKAFVAFKFEIPEKIDKIKPGDMVWLYVDNEGLEFFLFQGEYSDWVENEGAQSYKPDLIIKSKVVEEEEEEEKIIKKDIKKNEENSTGWSLYREDRDGNVEKLKLNIEKLPFHQAWKTAMKLIQKNYDKNVENAEKEGIKYPNYPDWDDIEIQKYYNNNLKFDLLKFEEPDEVPEDGVVVTLYNFYLEEAYFLFHGDFESWDKEDIRPYKPKNLSILKENIPTVLIVSDEDHELPIYIKRIPLSEEEIKFLNHSLISEDAVFAHVFYILISQSEPKDLELWLKDLQNIDNSFNMKTLITISKNQNNWELINFKQLNKLTSKGMKSNVYTINTYEH